MNEKELNEKVQSEDLREESGEVGARPVLDTPIDLNEETIEKVKEAVAEEVREEAGISEKQSELFKQMCEEATMPVEFLDKHFKLGPNELDIRGLSKRNLNQMFFRSLVLHAVYLKNIQSSLLDVTRLLLVLLDKLGVEDISKATDEIVDKIHEQTEALKQFKKSQEKNN